MGEEQPEPDLRVEPDLWVEEEVVSPMPGDLADIVDGCSTETDC